MPMMMMPEARSQGVALRGGKVSRLRVVAKCHDEQWQGVTLEGGGKVSRRWSRRMCRHRAQSENVASARSSVAAVPQQRAWVAAARASGIGMNTQQKGRRTTPICCAVSRATPICCAVSRAASCCTVAAVMARCHAGRWQGRWQGVTLSNGKGGGKVTRWAVERCHAGR